MLNHLLNQIIQQEQSEAKEKPTINPRYSKELIRLEFIKELNRLSLNSTFGQKSFRFDEENKQIIELVCQHLNNEVEFEQEGRSLNKGLWIYGNFGSGKTLIMKTYISLKKKFGDKAAFHTCNDMNMKFIDPDPITYKPNRYLGIKPYANKRDHVERVFDDLGEEELTINDFGNKICIMAYILGERYKGIENGVKTHITTNLTIEEISNDYGGRIESRVMGMFNFLKLGANLKSIDYRKK